MRCKSLKCLLCLADRDVCMIGTEECVYSFFLILLARCWWEYTVHAVSNHGKALIAIMPR